MAPKTVTSVKLFKRYLTSFIYIMRFRNGESVTWPGSGYQVESFKANTLLRGRSQGRITHEAIKTDRNREGVRRPNFT